MTRSAARSQVSARPPYRVWMMVTTLAIQAATIVGTWPNLKIGGFHCHFRHAIQSHHFALIATVPVIAACVCNYLLAQFVVVKSPVDNLPNPLVLKARSLPNFIQQDRNSESLIQFRRNLDEILRMDYPDSLSKAVAIRRWVRKQQAQDEHVWMPPFRRNHENPHRLLEEQRKGVPGACRRFSYILLGALLSAGFDARIACFTRSLRRGENHVTVEVWIEELTQWVLLDPTCDAMALVDGKVASALELQEVVVREQLDRITFQRNGATLEPCPSPAAYGRWCRHLFVAMSNAVFDGYSVRIVGPRRLRFLHYSRESAYPILRKQILLAVGGSGLGLSAMFWAWILFCLSAE
ncbi:MAG: hypothetical protein DMG97_07335 [Acidobacteria bacterium]|nr:MAG: hypothetical protein DMG98_25505 [Acidobacteriota bacterium]PYV75008.1 MAG: hypothetical protein DMG97_07335 [Acidobacteriota bacterium]